MKNNPPVMIRHFFNFFCIINLPFFCGNNLFASCIWIICQQYQKDKKPVVTIEKGPDTLRVKGPFLKDLMLICLHLLP